MFFILNAIWIVLLLISGGTFIKGNQPMAILFLVLGLLTLAVVYLIYNKRLASSSGWECCVLEGVGEALPDCIDCSGFDCIP